VPVDSSICCSLPCLVSLAPARNASFLDPRTADSRCPSILDVHIASTPPTQLQSHLLRFGPLLLLHLASSFCDLGLGSDFLLFAVRAYRTNGFFSVSPFLGDGRTRLLFRFPVVFPEPASGLGLWCSSVTARLPCGGFRIQSTTHTGIEASFESVESTLYPEFLWVVCSQLQTPRHNQLGDTTSDLHRRRTRRSKGTEYRRSRLSRRSTSDSQD